VLAANEMQVQMENNLSGLGAGVDDHTVTTFVHALPAGDIRGGQQQPRGEVGARLGQLIQARHVTVGDDEHVNRRRGVDVAEGGQSLVVMDNLRRCGAGHDPAKDALGVGVHGQS